MHVTTISVNSDSFPTKEYYPFDLDLFQNSPVLNLTAPVTFFAGENGTGKSTLLQAVSYSCHIYIWKGEDRPRFKKNPYENSMYRCVDVEWEKERIPGAFFSADIFRNFTQILDEWATSDPGVLDYFGGDSLYAKSHGQSLMSFFRSRFGLEGIYLLDEPETALSPKHQIELLHIVSEMAAKGHAQFIITTHSPILLSCPGAVIYSFDHNPIRRISYRDTEYYRVYRDFMQDPEAFQLGAFSSEKVLAEE